MCVYTYLMYVICHRNMRDNLGFMKGLTCGDCERTDSQELTEGKLEVLPRGPLGGASKGGARIDPCPQIGIQV